MGDRKESIIIIIPEETKETEEVKESVVTILPEETKEADFLFDSVLDGLDDLEKMYQNMEFFKVEKDQDYTVEGSIISCNYGYKLTRIGIVKDHAVYDNNGNAVLTCKDCVEGKNVYNFGLCGSPILDKNSEETVIERGVPFAVGQKIRGYKCKLQLDSSWQTGDVHTHIWNADKDKYEVALPEDGVLTCAYGAGIITIREINKNKKEQIADVYFVRESVNLRETPNGTQVQEWNGKVFKGRTFIGGAILKVASKETQFVEGSDEEWIQIYYDVTEKGWVAKRYLEELPKPIPGYQFKYRWEQSPEVTQDFKDKVVGICKELDIEPDYLMAVMAWESGFKPKAKNPIGSATGLVQFVEDVAHELNTTTAELANMTGLEQLDYVFGYYYRYKGKLKTIDDVYIRVFEPNGIGMEGSAVIERKGLKGYAGNAALDVNKDGVITKDEAVRPVLEIMERYK